MPKAVYRIRSLGLPLDRMPVHYGSVEAENIEEAVVSEARKLAEGMDLNAPDAPVAFLAQWYEVQAPPAHPDVYIEREARDRNPSGSVVLYRNDVDETQG